MSVVVVGLLSLVSDPTVVTAVIVLLLLLIAVDCRNHLLHDVLLTLRPRLKLVLLVAHHQLGSAIRRFTFVILHDCEVLFHSL